MCYHQAEQRDFRPAQSVQIDTEISRMLTERAQLERNRSQLVRQEFMLHDTAKFPTVSLPGLGGQAPHPQQNMTYPGNVMAQMNRNQYNVYLQQQQQQAMAAQAGYGPSPSKRPRHNSTTQMGMSATGIPMSHAKPKPAEVPDEVIEEAESTGADALDFLTPRDIALSRYTQHHEWLEEILSSPFDTHRIIPSELGLGRKGELESLTKDFFDAPVYQKTMGKKLQDPDRVTTEIVESNERVIRDEPIARVGRLEGNRAKDFSAKAADTLVAMNLEMEAMKKQHAKRMAKMNRGFAYKEAEQKLRSATLELINGEVKEVSSVRVKEVEDLQTALEQEEGMSIVPVAIVECTDKGGQEEVQERAIEEPQEPQDFDMTGTDTFDLDGAQLHTPSEPTIPTTVAAEHSTAKSMPASDVQDEPERSPPVQNEQVQTTQQDSETVDAAAASAEDYVMVSKDDASGEDADEPTDPTNPSGYAEPTNDNTTGDPPDFGDAQQDSFEPNGSGEDSIDFGDMDTAGDELSGYAQEIANMSARAGDQSELGLDSPPTTSIIPEDGARAEQSDQSGL